MSTSSVPITSPDQIEITPQDITLPEDKYFDCFEDNTTEIGAKFLIGLFQERGSWGTFTKKEFLAYYKKVQIDLSFSLHHILNQKKHNPNVIRIKGNTFAVTEEFIRKCAAAAEAAAK